jgi:hypothetical protein
MWLPPRFPLSGGGNGFDHDSLVEIDIFVIFFTVKELDSLDRGSRDQAPLQVDPNAVSHHPLHTLERFLSYVASSFE